MSGSCFCFDWLCFLLCGIRRYDLLLGTFVSHLAADLFGRLLADVVELGTSDLGALQNLDLIDGRRKQRENALHPYPVDDAAHGERAAGFVAVLPRKDEPFEGLKTMLLLDLVFLDDSLRDLLPDAHAVSGFEAEILALIDVHGRNGDRHSRGTLAPIQRKVNPVLQDRERYGKVRGRTMKTKPTALITGGSSGIGLAAGKLLQYTHNLVLVARSPDRLERAIKHLSAVNDCTIVQGDVADRSVCERAMRVHQPDLLLHSAGIIANCGLRDDAAKHAESVMRTNYLGTVNMLQAAHDSMPAGNIGVIGSISGLFPAPGGYSVYGASKAALASFCESVRQELFRKGLTLTVAHFSFVATAMSADKSDSIVDVRRKMRRFKRFTAEHAARRLIEDTLAGKKESHLCFTHILLARFARIAPRTFAALIRWRAGIT